jgi:hypothetical protein
VKYKVSQRLDSEHTFVSSSLGIKIRLLASLRRHFIPVSNMFIVELSARCQKRRFGSSFLCQEFLCQSSVVPMGARLYGCIFSRMMNSDFGTFCSAANSTQFSLLTGFAVLECPLSKVFVTVSSPSYNTFLFS